MAVVNVPQSTALCLKLQTGLTESGKPQYKTYSWTNVKTGAADADVYAIGQAISAVQKYPLAEVERRNLGSLQEQ